MRPAFGSVHLLICVHDHLCHASIDFALQTGKTTQHIVVRRMALGVVDDFEPVEINANERSRPFRARSKGQYILRRRDQAAAVRQLREIINR